LFVCASKRFKTCYRERALIARHWRGWTKRADADAYEDLLKNKVIPGLKGSNYLVPVFEPEAKALLIRMENYATHYEVRYTTE
jgi:hypothetical protein